MKKLNKNNLIDIVSEKLMMNKKEVREVVETLLEIIEETLVNNREVNLTNFGVFTPKVRMPRVGTHPKLHNTIDIASTKVVTFRMAKSLKARINN